LTMTELGLSHHKRAVLAQHWAEQRAQRWRVDPFWAKQQRFKPVQAAHRAVKLAAVVLLVLLAHMAIWWLARALPTQPLPKPITQAVVIEIVKPPLAPPKIPPVTAQPVKIPPITPKPQAAAQPQKIVAKPVLSKALPQPKPVVQQAPIVQQQAAEPTTPVAAEAVAEPVAAKASTSQPSTEAKGYAGYLGNPAAEYPELALERGWQGSVVLRVKVAANGAPASISIKSSSGRKVLDNAAQRAVQGWRFAPATRGTTAVEGWVDVPIHFKLP
jgi:protein TonB